MEDMEKHDTDSTSGDNPTAIFPRESIWINTPNIAAFQYTDSIRMQKKHVRILPLREPGVSQLYYVHHPFWEANSVETDPGKLTLLGKAAFPFFQELNEYNII